MWHLLSLRKRACLSLYIVYLLLFSGPLSCWWNHEVTVLGYTAPSEVVHDHSAASLPKEILSEIEQGHSTYLQALTASSKREILFNEALSSYLRVASHAPLPEVYANIGTLYFYLGDTGLAVFYLLQAHKKAPHDSDIVRALTAVRSVAHLEHRYFSPSWIEYMSAQSIMSSQTRNGVVIALILCSTVLLSLWIWLPMRGLQIAWQCMVGVMCVTIVCCIVCPLMFGYQHAIVAVSTALTQPQQEQGGANTREDTASSSYWLLPGEEVQIVTKILHKQQLKVKTAQGIIGYIAADKVHYLPFE